MKAIVIAGTTSGVGKTTVATGLMGACQITDKAKSEAVIRELIPVSLPEG